ncbi:MAG TPA: SirB2 family protein [Lacunisphaera sp.]|nr:SirB2 family protein [Lacunisphaera sp.]
MERLPYYHILHLLSLIVLTAHTFMAFANPDPVNKKRTMIITGIATLLLLVSGFGMLSILKIPISTGWVIVKLICWLFLSGLAGMAYRKTEMRGVFSVVALVLITVALFMVYLRPF